jgi:hypothetical protein
MIESLRRRVAATPIIGDGARMLRRLIAPRPIPFDTSADYWERRYQDGGNSGAGSYGRLALFKAAVLNAFVAEHDIASIVEFGSGDGAQLQLACYPRYTGVDVSWQAVIQCREKFAQDKTRKFLHVSQYEKNPEMAEMAMSLDVIYHLVEDATYFAYMNRLVAAAERFVCFYSSDFDGPGPAPHVRHRCLTDWMAHNAPGWKLIANIPNKYPPDPSNPDETSWADFFFYGREGAA